MQKERVERLAREHGFFKPGMFDAEEVDLNDLMDFLRELWCLNPMETAPKDGREVLLKVERRAGISNCWLVGHYQPGGYCIEDHPAIAEGWYFWNGHLFDSASKPIGWMYLPDDLKEYKAS